MGLTNFTEKELSQKHPDSVSLDLSNSKNLELKKQELLNARNSFF